MKEAMLVSGILDPDAQSSLLLPMIPTILSRQKGFLCHATRQTRRNWPRMKRVARHLKTILIGQLICRPSLWAKVGAKPCNLPKTSRPIRTTQSLFTQRWRSKRFTQVRDEVRKLTSCRRDFASTSQFTTC